MREAAQNLWLHGPDWDDVAANLEHRAAAIEAKLTGASAAREECTDLPLKMRAVPLSAEQILDRVRALADECGCVLSSPASWRKAGSAAPRR